MAESARRPGPERTVVVTDSTASLSDESLAAAGIKVVPLEVIIDQVPFREGVDAEAAPGRVAEALRGRSTVTTSQPGPGVFAELYDALVAEGAEAIVSVHLSERVSGTLRSAQLAAATCAVPVHVVDSGHIGAVTGHAALAAVDALRANRSPGQAALLAETLASRSSSMFYVDTLEYLRRGGRIGAASALIGSALTVKPLLEVKDGEVVALDRVRTSARAMGRLLELTVSAATALGQAQVTVAHLEAPERAQGLVDRLTAQAGAEAGGPLVTPVTQIELGAVLGAHAGPGMVGVSVSPITRDGALVTPSGA